MDDLDIQTAQLIIQLARDDLYQLDDNAFSGNNQVSDLELALAEQEREFMQHWTGYGGAQINRNAGGRSGNGSNVGDSAVAGPSRVTSLIHRARSLQLRPVTPINPIDDDDDYDDMYINPYEPTSAASSSSNDPEPASRAAHEPAPAASRSSSSIGATTSIAGSALPNDDGPYPNSPTLEQLLEQGFALFYLF